MNPELHNDPHVIGLMALASLALLAYQTWKKRHD